MAGHSHHHAHHADGHSKVNTFRRLGFSVLLTLSFVLVEAVAGFFSHSLALFSDAGHNLADALALILSWYGLWMARRPADSSRTFGFHRVSILVALANAMSLVVISLVIFWQAYQRLTSPGVVESGPMISVALVALVLNLAIGWGLHAGAKTDLSLKSAYLHMLGDAVSAAAVVVAGLMVRYGGSAVADPIVSLLIAVLILYSSWGILVEAVNVLLEASPKGLDMEGVEKAILTVEGVLNVHDLHVWTLSSGIIAASCHIQVTEQSIRSGQQVLAKVVRELQGRYAISHTTVQVEVEGCNPNEMYCTMQPMQNEHHH